MVRRVMVTARPPWLPLRQQRAERRQASLRVRRGGMLPGQVRRWIEGELLRLAAEGGE